MNEWTDGSMDVRKHGEVGWKDLYKNKLMDGWTYEGIGGGVRKFMDA